MFAAYRNFPKVLSLLLGAGADAAMANDNGDAAISLAAGCGNASECVALLLGVPFPPSPGNSPDINTSTTGNSISSKSLTLVKPKSLDACNNVGRNQVDQQMFKAAAMDDLPMLKAAIRNGADPLGSTGSKTVFEIARDRSAVKVEAYLRNFLRRSM